MSFDRYPALKLNHAARSCISWLAERGLVVESVVRVPNGIVAYHTIRVETTGEVFLHEGYTNDLCHFVAGVKAAEHPDTRLKS